MDTGQAVIRFTPPAWAQRIEKDLDLFSSLLSLGTIFPHKIVKNYYKYEDDFWHALYVYICCERCKLHVDLYGEQKS